MRIAVGSFLLRALLAGRSDLACCLSAEDHASRKFPESRPYQLVARRRIWCRVRSVCPPSQSSLNRCCARRATVACHRFHGSRWRGCGRPKARRLRSTCRGRACARCSPRCSSAPARTSPTTSSHSCSSTCRRPTRTRASLPTRSTRRARSAHGRGAPTCSPQRPACRLTSPRSRLERHSSLCWSRRFTLTLALSLSLALALISALCLPLALTLALTLRRRCGAGVA